MSATAIFELRRENLSKIIDHWIASKRFETGKAMCEHFDVEPAYIAQLLNSKRQIGEKSARALEQKLGLEPFRLDQEKLAMVEVQEQKTTCFDMHIVDAELFQLKPRQVDLNTFGFLNLTPSHYLICIPATIYQPVLRAGDILILDQNASAKINDRVCVYLNNGCQLILEYLSETELLYAFQSLDAKRQVNFQKTDVEHMHHLVAIVSL